MLIVKLLWNVHERGFETEFRLECSLLRLAGILKGDSCCRVALDFFESGAVTGLRGWRFTAVTAGQQGSVQNEFRHVANSTGYVIQKVSSPLPLGPDVVLLDQTVLMLVASGNDKSSFQVPDSARSAPARTEFVDFVFLLPAITRHTRSGLRDFLPSWPAKDFCSSIALLKDYAKQPEVYQYRTARSTPCSITEAKDSPKKSATAAYSVQNLILQISVSRARRIMHIAAMQF